MTVSVVSIRFKLKLALCRPQYGAAGWRIEPVVLDGGLVPLISVDPTVRLIRLGE